MDRFCVPRPNRTVLETSNVNPHNGHTTLRDTFLCEWPVESNTHTRTYLKIMSHQPVVFLYIIIFYNILLCTREEHPKSARVAVPKYIQSDRRASSPPVFSINSELI